MVACGVRWMFASAVVVGGCHAGTQVATLVIDGDTITMRDRAAGAAQSSPASTQVMIVALDGVSRDLLYDLLRGGKLPHLAELIGGADLAHADLDDRLLSNLPSTTIPAWSAVFTGTPAGVNGVPNNEFFIRETKTFAAPAPVTFVDSGATMEVYTKGAVNKLVDAPSVYERIHTADPDALIWVALSHFFRGADKMFVAERTAFVKMFAAFVEDGLPREERKVTSRKPYEALDHGAIDAVVSHLASGPVPDVLTLYLSGTDLYAHVAKEGPDEARRAYLTEVVDPALAKLVEQHARARHARESLGDRDRRSRPHRDHRGRGALDRHRQRRCAGRAARARLEAPAVSRVGRATAIRITRCSRTAARSGSCTSRIARAAPASARVRGMRRRAIARTCSRSPKRSLATTTPARSHPACAARWT